MHNYHLWLLWNIACYVLYNEHRSGQLNCGTQHSGRTDPVLHIHLLRTATRTAVPIASHDNLLLLQRKQRPAQLGFMQLTNWLINQATNSLAAT